MFDSQGKHVKAVHTTSAAVNSEEIGEDTLQNQYLSHNSHKYQNKIDAQTAKTASVRSELDKALQENQKLKNLSNADQLVEAMTKVVSTMTMKEQPKTSQGSQYKGPTWTNLKEVKSVVWTEMTN